MSLYREHITKEIIGAAVVVHHELGFGLLEKAYQNAMIVELKHRGLETTAEKLVQVHLKNNIVGDYKADLIVDELIVELTVAPRYNSKDEPHLLNELTATKSPVGLLINFGRDKVEFKRFN